MSIYDVTFLLTHVGMSSKLWFHHFVGILSAEILSDAGGSNGSTDETMALLALLETLP